jgi:5'-nucleotidase
MKILLTNDDAYFAEGIQVLSRELQKHWDVMLVAPDREQSATSHSLTLNQPLRINALNKKVYSVDGTAVDCVLLSVYSLLKKKPDLVISGINHGPNLGDDVIYSGTVAGAREGALLGIPSLAISVTAWTGCRFDYATKFATRLVRRIARKGLPDNSFLNINIPNKPARQIKGANLTRLGTRTYRNIIDRRTDPRGKSYYWISGTPVWKRERDTDYQAIRENRVSITPLTLDMNNYQIKNELKNILNGELS